MDSATLKDKVATSELRLPTSVFFCFGVLGLTTGLYTGLSESPVVGTIVTGILSVLVGGVLALVVGRQELPQVSAARLAGVATCVILLCLLSVVGALVGIGFRTGRLAEYFGQSPTVIALHDLKQYRDKVPPHKMVKLVIAQQAFVHHGIKNEENNRLIQSFADPLVKGMSGVAMAERPESHALFKKCISDSREVLSVVNANYLEFKFANDQIRKMIDEGAVKDPGHVDTLKKLVNKLSELPSMDSVRRTLVECDEADRALFDLIQPELDVVLDYLLNYGATLSPHQSKSDASSGQKPISLNL